MRSREPLWEHAPALKHYPVAGFEGSEEPNTSFAWPTACTRPRVMIERLRREQETDRPPRDAQEARSRIAFGMSAGSAAVVFGNSYANERRKEEREAPPQP